MARPSVASQNVEHILSIATATIEVPARTKAMTAMTEAGIIDVNSCLSAFTAILNS